MDRTAYLQRQKEEEAGYEARCKRCGACCGSLGDDPCSRLRKEASGKYFCSVYDTRIGKQFTISGKEFSCVPIRYLRPQLPYKDCAYYKNGED